MTAEKSNSNDRDPSRPDFLYPLATDNQPAQRNSLPDGKSDAACQPIDADAAVAKAEAEARIAEAEAKTKVASVRAEAEIKAAKQAASAKVADEKSKRRAKSFKRMKRKFTMRVMLAIAIAIVVIFIAVAAAHQITKPTEFINSSQLTKIVAVNKLAVVDFTYEGVAEYNGDGHQDNPLHIHYSAKVKATFNPGDIYFAIDDETKTVTPILPNISISSPNIDDRIDILEGEAQNIDMASVYNACKEDAAAEVQAKSNIKDMAVNNAHKAVEGLTMNLLKSKGYTIVWPEGTENPLQEGEGGNYAA